MILDFVIFVAPFREPANSRQFLIDHDTQATHRPLQTQSSRIETHYFMASNTIFENAAGTTISGDGWQIINAGGDVNIHPPSAGTLRLYFIRAFSPIRCIQVCRNCLGLSVTRHTPAQVQSQSVILALALKSLTGSSSGLIGVINNLSVGLMGRLVMANPRYRKPLHSAMPTRAGF